jgi:hypothetical protein
MTAPDSAPTFAEDDERIAQWLLMTLTMFGVSVANKYRIVGLFIEAIHGEP